MERDRREQFQVELDETGKDLKLANSKIAELVQAQTKSAKNTRKLESQIKSQSEQFKRSQELLQEKTNEVQTSKRACYREKRKSGEIGQN